MPDDTKISAERLEQYRAYLRLLSRMQLSPRLRPKVDESDLAQQTLIQAATGLEQFRGKTESELLAWLRAILANNLKHAIRDFGRQKRDVRRELSIEQKLEQSSMRMEQWLVTDQSTPSCRITASERVVQLAAALETLPESQRQAVELHYLRGAKLREIAQLMDRSTSAVAGLLHRGLSALRQQLDN